MESTNPDARRPESTRVDRGAVSPARRRTGAVLAFVVLAVLGLVLWQTWDYWRPDDDAAPAFRGPGGAQPRGGFAGGPPPGQADPARMSRLFHDRIRSAMVASDEEWAKIQPKVEKVTSIQDRLRPGPGGMMAPPPFGGPPGTLSGGPSPGAGAADPDPIAASGRAGGPDGDDVAEKTSMLRAAIEDEHTPPEALAANLAAARAARAKLAAELKTAQEDLRQQVTPRQEAILVTFGVLE